MVPSASVLLDRGRTRLIFCCQRLRSFGFRTRSRITINKYGGIKSTGIASRLRESELESIARLERRGNRYYPLEITRVLG